MLVACSAKNIKLYNPANQIDARKQSVIGFGLFRRVPSLLFSDSAMSFGISNIELSEVVSVDDKNKKVATTLFIPEKPIEVKEGDKKVYYGQTPNLENYFTLLIRDVNKKYCISKITWTESRTYSCGPGCQRTQTIIFNRYPNPYQSFKALPIQSEPGKIVFKGITEMQDADTTEEDPETAPYKFYDLILFKKKWKKTVLNPTSDFELKNLKKYYFLNKEDTDPSSAKKRFFTSIIERQGSGYWKEEATKELAKLK